MKLSYIHLKMNMIVTMKIQWWKNLGPPKLQSGYVIGASSSQSSFFWWYPLLLLHWQLYWSHILQVCLNLAYCTSSCSKVLNHLSFFHTSYGNTGWGVFKSGVQSQKDLRINILNEIIKFWELEKQEPQKFSKIRVLKSIIFILPFT